MIEGIRTISEQFEYGYMRFDGATWLPYNSETTQWEGIPAKAACFNESYIDLSGYELEDLTVAPISVIVQDPGIYQFNGNPDVFAMYDLVSMERLTTADLQSIKANMTTEVQNAPGMPKGPLDRAQIIYGQFRLMAANSTVVGLPTMMLNARTVRFGSGNPTAVSKLWCYRIIAFVSTPTANDRLTIPAATFVLNIKVVKESELPYMMRLKRSYELSTGN